ANQSAQLVLILLDGLRGLGDLTLNQGVMLAQVSLEVLPADTDSQLGLRRTLSTSAADHSWMCSTSASASRLSSSALVEARNRTISTWAPRLSAMSAAIRSRSRSAVACIVRAISWWNVGTRPASAVPASSVGYAVSLPPPGELPGASADSAESPDRDTVSCCI